MTAATAGEQSAGLYEYCDSAPAGDPLCYTGRYGNNLEAADKFLEGPDVGPGGLVEMTANDDGFPAHSTPVGSPLSMVNATFTVDISEAVPSEGTCQVFMDRDSQLGAVTDLESNVQAFLIFNPVVQTVDGIRAGSTLEDVVARYDVDVEQYGTGKIAYTDRQGVVSQYGAVEQGRAMLFSISADDVVDMWVVGATSFVQGILSDGLCPVA